MTSNDVRTMLETSNGVEAVSMSKVGQKELSEVIRGLGHEPDLIPYKELEDIAVRLSALAHKDPAWSWRYLRNVLNGKLDASKPLLDAIMRLGALIDGTPEVVAKSTAVSVMAIGKVAPGALILGDSRRCANPGCRMEFVPRVPWQQCHSAECARVWRQVRASGGSTSSPTGKGSE